MGFDVPQRYLVAYIGNPRRKALLRFPPGVTLQDAGFDQVPMPPEPLLPGDTLDRLSRLGVETVAVGSKAVDKTLKRAAASLFSLDAFAEDYLDTNARLGGTRYVTFCEYAMDTRVRLLRIPLRDRSTKTESLHLLLGDHLLLMDNVRVYGNVAFPTRRLPRTLHLRLAHIARHDVSCSTRALVPCRIHGDGCLNYPDRKHDPGLAIASNALGTCLGSRVAIPRRLLDDLARDTDRRTRVIARAARAVARLVLDAVPADAWMSNRPSPELVTMVALATAETCEEYVTLLGALEKCRSARQVVRRARDASWVVSRTLEGLRDRW